MAENRQNVRNPPHLSSALFYIRLVIRDFSKTAEDRSSADTAISIHVAILPVPTGKVYRFPTNSGHFLPANPLTPLIPLTALEAGGRKDQILPSCAEGGKPFLPACLHATPSPAASCTGVHLRNVRAYIIFDCPRGIFADNHSALCCNSAGSEQAVGDAEGDGAAVGVDVQEQVVVIGDKSVRTLKSEADVAGKVLDVRDDSGCAAVLV